jgi:hypothetical protein
MPADCLIIGVKARCFNVAGHLYLLEDLALAG